MIDPMWAALGDKVEPDWAPERERAIQAALARRAARRRALSRTVAAVGSAGVLVAAGFAVVSWRHPESAPATADRSETVRITELSPGTVLAPLPDRDGRGFRLRAGGARFSVAHDAHRPFMVEAGNVTIEAL